MNNFNFKNERGFAQDLDKNDPLNHYRSKFLLPQNKNGYSCVYLCGNSLGLQPNTTKQYLEEELNDWSKYGVHGHTKAKRPWLTYHLQAREGFAELTGSKECEVIAMNTLTVNLHMLMVIKLNEYKILLTLTKKMKSKDLVFCK